MLCPHSACVYMCACAWTALAANLSKDVPGLTRRELTALRADEGLTLDDLVRVQKSKLGACRCSGRPKRGGGGEVEAQA